MGRPRSVNKLLEWLGSGWGTLRATEVHVDDPNRIGLNPASVPVAVTGLAAEGEGLDGLVHNRQGIAETDVGCSYKDDPSYTAV